MRLLRDLWATSAPRTAAVGLLMLLWAAGQAGAAALTGDVLVDRSRTAFVLLAVAVVVAVLSDLVLSLLAARLSADWSADLRRRLCRRAIGQDIPTLEKTPVGELLDRIDGDVYQVATELRHSGLRIGQSTCAAVLSTLTAFLVWWPAGVVMAVLGVLLVVSLTGPLQRIAPAREREEEAWSDLAAVMEEAIHGQDDVRTSLGQAYVLRLYARRASDVMRRGLVVWQASSRVSAIAAAAVRCGIALLVAGGAWAFATGHVDGARLTGIWLLALAYGATVEMISRMISELQYGLGAWQRVQLLLAATQEPEGGRSAREGDLTVRGLTFTYTDAVDDGTGRRPALRDVRLTFRPGRSYAVIGRTGSGKSSLAKVLTRAVDLPRGHVFLGDSDLLDLDLESLRRWIAVIPQRTEILAGTVAENVALFDPELLPRAAQALEELELAAWVAELPDGIETRLGDGGHKLSAGQEQLVAFARILVRDPHVVILDEATARMDPVTEAAVQRATERLLRDRIGIVIAHRLSSVSRCNEVVVLDDGAVVEAGPLRDSEQFARLLAHGRLGSAALAEDDEELLGGSDTGDTLDAVLSAESRGDAARADIPRTDPPPLPEPPAARTLREVLRLVTNDARYGLSAVALFMGLSILGLDGSVLPWLWAQLVDDTGSVLWPAVGIVAALVVTMPIPYYTGSWFPQWWVMQMLRISLRLVHGQTGPRRVSAHTPAEVVAQGGDTERVVMLADNMVDQFTSIVIVVTMTLVSGSIVPALFFVGTMAASGAAATLFGPALKAAAQRTVAARAAFATALVSSLSAARTVKLAGAGRPVLAHLARLDAHRSELQRQEISLQVWARSTPSLVSGLLPIGAWALYLGGRVSAASVLIIVSTLGAARWFAWTTASLIAQLPSARVWTRRTAAMAGVGAYSAPVPGVDLWRGTAPAPPVAPRTPLRRLDLVRFGAVHEDGTLGAHDVDLTVRRGELVLVVGPVGAGKSSLLRALAGIVHHTGELRWNGEPIDAPEVFLRPNQVGYVAQLPRVLSGTVGENIRLGHEVDAGVAVTTAQLEHDLDVLTAAPETASGATGTFGSSLAGTGTATATRPMPRSDDGLGLLIGHKGTRLSGGQLQRLALARALAPQTELLVADDISSALDVVTELDLWEALRERGVTVIGSTSKRAALALADQVVVLVGGRAVASGRWRNLEDRWGHLAG